MNDLGQLLALLFYINLVEDQVCYVALSLQNENLKVDKHLE